MRYFWLIPAWLGLLFTIAAAAGYQQPATDKVHSVAGNALPVVERAGPSENPQCVRVIRSDLNGVTLALDFAAPVLTPVPLSGGASRIEVAGCTRTEQPEEPDLPQLRLMCGIAQQGTIRLAINTGDGEEIGDCAIVPGLTYRSQADHGPIAEDYVRGPLFEQDRWLPAQTVRLEDIELVRDVRVARLTVSPVQYNPQQRRLRYYRHLAVQISFTEPAQRSGAGIGGDPFEKLYPFMLVNGNTARDWKTSSSVQALEGSRTQGAGVATGGSFFDRSQVWLKIKVETTGVYRLGYDDLKACGINPDFIDPRTFQLFTAIEHVPGTSYPDTMKEVAIAIGHAEQGIGPNDDSLFGRSDYLVFYGRAISDWDSRRRSFVMNPYSRGNFYWLTWGGAKGRRMRQGLGLPESGAPRRTSGFWRQHLEQDQTCPARCGLLWIWNQMEKSNGNDSLLAGFSLNLAHPRYIKNLSGQLYSTMGGNDLNVLLNGQLLDSFEFDARSYSDAFRFSLDYDSLSADPDFDTLTLELRGNSAMEALFDWLEVTYVKRLQLDAAGALDFYVAESSAQNYSVAGLTALPLVMKLDDRDAPAILTGGLVRADTLTFRDVVSETAYYLVTDYGHLRRPVSVERRTPGRLRALNADYFIVAPEQLYDVARVLEHYRNDNVAGLTHALVRTVRLEDVYDDFAFGRPEPIAIKDFFRTTRPAYGLLLGDATYDYRDLLDLHPRPGVPSFEDGYSADPSGYSAASRAMDAWYADFDGTGSTPDMFLGRLTARTPDELRQFITKLMNYEHAKYGAWCQRGIAVADDEWLGAVDTMQPDRIGLDHTRASETIAALWGESFNVAKVYLTEYPFAGYGDKPGARKELIRQLKLGALFFCYFGHGAGEAITSENLFNVQLVPQLINDGRSPLALFASCAVGRWEDTRFECIAEEMARLPNGGAIAGIGASKATQPTSNLEFARNLFRVLLDTTHPTLGQAFAAGLPSLNLYHLFGDPATRIPLADSGGAALYVKDTLEPGRPCEFSASYPFASGWVETRAAGPLWMRTYSTHAHISNPSVTYILPGDEFYRGTGRIRQGLASGRFVVPEGTRRGTRTVPDGSYIEVTRSARLAADAWDGSHFLALQNRKLVLDTIQAASSDHTGPEIALYADGVRLSATDTTTVPAEFTLTGRLSDSSGILISPLPSGDVFYAYVGDYRNRVGLADAFAYDLGSATSGSFNCPLSLERGTDSIIVTAADNFGNRATACARVRVLDEIALAVSEPLVYPNPVNDRADFTFRLSTPAGVTVKVFTLSGRLLRTLDLTGARSGFNQLAWDGRDRQGALLPNGVYLYTVTARTFNDESDSLAPAVVRDKFIVRR